METDETFFVDLTNAGIATLGDGQGTGTIANDDTPAVVPSISINDVTIGECDAGTTNATFVVTMNAPTSNTGYSPAPSANDSRIS